MLTSKNVIKLIEDAIVDTGVYVCNISPNNQSVKAVLQHPAMVDLFSSEPYDKVVFFDN